VIRLRCHKKKWKRCRKESALLPVNGTYTCRRDTSFVSQHINTLSLNMTATADAAQFLPRGQVAPRVAQRFRSDLCIGHGDLLSKVSFILWSLSVYKWLAVPPHDKVWRLQARKNLGAMGWAHHGRTNDVCMCRLKTPALWEQNVAEPYMGILSAHIQTNCSEICTLTSCIQRFTFLTSQTDHPVFPFTFCIIDEPCRYATDFKLTKKKFQLSSVTSVAILDDNNFTTE
jgi:hypothetical protein